MASKARRKLPGIPNYYDHASLERHISAEQHARNLNRQEMWVGQKGEGKSVGVVQRLSNLLNHSDDQYTPKVAEISDDEMKALYRAEKYREENILRQPFVYFPEMNTVVQASGSGGGGSYNIDYQQQPQTNKQSSSGWWDNQQAPWHYQWDTVPNTNTYPPTSIQQTPQKQDESKKQEFKPEDYKGKFCAIVTLTHRDVERVGILFVKKCGHWGLRGYNGDKIAGGTSGSFEAELKKGTLKITVHQTIYTDAPPEIGENELEIH